MDKDDPWDEGDGDALEAEMIDHAGRPRLRRGAARNHAGGGDRRSGSRGSPRPERPDGRTVNEAVAVVDDGDPDIEGELIAEGSLVADDFPAPEESALSIRDDAPGATDHEDPHPVD
jgi:hypothetical protein